MIEWVTVDTGPRPVPRPVTTPLIWAGAFGGALALMTLLHTVVGPHRPGLFLAALSLLAAVLGGCARFTAAPGTAVLCWLFLNGFATPPTGTLTWAGPRDTFLLGCLLTAALVGTTASRLAHARAAYHRLTLRTDPEDGRPA
ncbi:hypothetical protein [Streptomyces cathayae]|uniref:Sensor protein KdpD transmembrane domain-containing protein n=1 Tax=Streptomyces cathayae TaxID=3031124 RepID=A0ABY8KEK5_9ACTN|nr:hypothetical protein [Streptomyces sp. HUAS 5]WGD44948.1 hypothetical protein PYS65_19120 [Streptomyces sp. HUAS 5]